MFNEKKLKKFIDFAKLGDFRKILEIPTDTNPRNFLAQHPEYQKDNFKWERLIALYLTKEFTQNDEISGIIYDFSEHDIFCYDDDGYVMCALNIDIATIKSSQLFGVFDPENALLLWQELIQSNKEQVVDRLNERMKLIDDSILRKLKSLLA